ncbi:MAG: exodeoxyribonuclease VII large subunit [Tannerella sp.]|jgi:exodeoxyribonuclease VII large subunit|nr:exodeoxyribonuclease VII large subunit [Tannerella sp.]
MSETVKDKRVFSLLEVMRSIQKTLTNRYKSSFWVKAEMNKLNFYKQSGHCYPDLVEKQDGKTIAQMRAVLWKDDYRRINRLFMETLHEPLKDGIKILFQAEIAFDPTHGITLHITNIDPDYTVGDLEKEKQETIRRMMEEGLFERNKLLELPLLLQRIAIISVETSKGYKDFMSKIEQNACDYRFFHLLFPSLLQGEKIIRSISAQLEKIRKVMHHFDAVVIVRGGGGDIGLSSYNSYALAKEIALFPLPVLTGIGHITNKTVVEMVAFKNLITPTDLADFLIRRFRDFSRLLKDAEEKTVILAGRIIDNERLKLQSEIRQLHSATAFVLFHHRNSIVRLREKLSDKSSLQIREQFAWLENREIHVRSMDPGEIMKRGFSVTLHENKIVRNIAQLAKGDRLNTFIFGGRITSEVQSVDKEETL